jgi:hypothetical protein
LSQKISLPLFSLSSIKAFNVFFSLPLVSLLVPSFRHLSSTSHSLPHLLQICLSLLYPLIFPALSPSQVSLFLSYDTKVYLLIYVALTPSCSPQTFLVSLSLLLSLDERIHQTPLTSCTRSPHPCQPLHLPTAGCPADPSPVTPPFRLIVASPLLQKQPEPSSLPSCSLFLSCVEASIFVETIN